MKRSAFQVGSVASWARASRARGRPLFRSGRGAAERVEQLAEVLDGLAAREDAHQRLERLAELRVGVERRQVVAGGRRLFAGGLLEDAALVQQKRLRALVWLGRGLGAE